MELVFNSYYTLITATLVLLLGKLMVKKIRFLQDFNIPEPVAGGLVAAIIIYVLYSVFQISFTFEKPLQDAFMLIFFSSIGLSADFSRLKAGGFPLIIFLIVVGIFIVIQDIVGVGLAKILGIDPRIGLIAGSITMTGGHGTAGGWGPTLEEAGLVGATGLGLACATFGLVTGGLIGGPVARRLINKMGRQPLSSSADDNNIEIDDRTDDVFEKSEKVRTITASSAIETLAMFAACLAFAEMMDGIDSQFKGFYLDLPKFVWALAGGLILRNVLTIGFKFSIFDRAIDVFGNAFLSLFLAMALLSLKLWQLTGLAIPVTIILVMQVALMALYATFVTYVAMGRDYDAAVLAAGHSGFGLGATPTAIANMQAITQHFGPSHKAFLILPMVGAFLVDFINCKN
ncbi:MAG: sodium/glutamate symporter [Cardiobacteriaceae bacterium]|nr:sodium/glutamate symporter [Cardiobacteriaceae bacterium]